MNWLQRHWDERAAANFILGGAGSGLLLVGVFSPLKSDSFLWAALVLIAAGLSAVWLEIGRKLRAIHVFFNPFTSWMTRESFAAGAIFLLALAFLLTRKEFLLYGVAVAAAAFLWFQARILRAAKGIPAWRAPQVVPLVVFTGLAEGSGLCLFFDGSASVLAVFALAVLARAMAWKHYRAAVKGASLDAPGKELLRVGTVAALALAIASGFFPVIAPLAGLAAILPGWWVKLALVTRASFNQGYSLPRLPVRGTR